MLTNHWSNVGIKLQVQMVNVSFPGAAPVAQRCLSDPGTEGPSVLSKGVREHLLGEEMQMRSHL